MSSSGQPQTKYVLVGVLSALGGAVLGVSSTVLFNRFRGESVNTNNERNTSYDANNNTHNSKNSTNYVDSSDEPDVDSQTKNEVPTTEQGQTQLGVYIQEQEGNRVFLTNEEFQKYFELHVGENNSGVELDTCFLDYALKIDPMNLRFFADSQKTPIYERVAVDGNLAAIQFCKNHPYTDDVNELSYTKYDIEEYAYAKYGDDIFEYIDPSYKTERNMLRSLKTQIQQDLKNYTNKKQDNNYNDTVNIVDNSVVTIPEGGPATPAADVEVYENTENNVQENDVDIDAEVLTTSRAEVPVFESVDADLDSEQSSSSSSTSINSIEDH